MGRRRGQGSLAPTVPWPRAGARARATLVGCVGGVSVEPLAQGQCLGGMAGWRHDNGRWTVLPGHDEDAHWGGGQGGGGGWEDAEAWQRVFAMRHRSGWVEYCEDGDDPASAALARAETREWLEAGSRHDGWASGCLTGFLMGAAAVLVLWLWVAFT